MSMFGAYAANNDPASQNNFNPSWMGQTFNPTSGVPRPVGRPNGVNGEGGEEERPMAAPIFMRNRYGREDVLALYDGGSVHPPDNLPRCPLYQSEAQPPCVIKPLSDIEKKLRENINSSKAMSMLSAADRHHISSGGQAPDSPQAANRNNTNGWTHVPARDHNKTWGRTTTGTTPVRGSVRGAFTGGRGGGTAGGTTMEGGPLNTSPYGPPTTQGGTQQNNGERALGTGGTFPSRRGVNPVASRGGSSSSFNSRAQGLYNPHDPSDRPRQRGRSTSEDGEGTTVTSPTTPSVGGGVVNGGGGGSAQPGVWQARSSAWGMQQQQQTQQRMPEWATDEEGVPSGVNRDHSSDISSGTFDEQGRFVRTAPRSTILQGQQSQQYQTTPQSVQHESHQRVSPQSSMHPSNWMERDVPLSAPVEISSHSSTHYSIPSSLSSQPPSQQADLQGGVSGMSPSSAFLHLAYQQQQKLQLQQQQAAHLQQQQQAAQYAAMQQAQQLQQQQQAAASVPSKPSTYFYLDPNGVERGPFQQDQMEAWFSMGYFQDSLQVRRDSDTDFTELGELQRINGKNPFKYPEPVAVPPPTPNMLAGYMDHQLGLGSAAGWDQSVQSIFRTAQATPSYEQLLEKQRMDQRERQIAEEREQLRKMQEMMRAQHESEREQHEKALREKEEGLQKMQDEMMRKQREMEEAKRETEAALEKEKREIERKRAELEKQSIREREEQKKKEDAERRKTEELNEKKRIEQERIAAAEDAEREKERVKRRAEEAKRQAEEEKKRNEEERKKLEAFARAEELRVEAEAERERQAQIAAARKAAAPPPVVTPPAAPTVVKSSGPAWGGAGIAKTATAVKKSVETRSLAEVMAEEERQARAEQRENDRLRKEAEAAAPKKVSSKGGVWGGSTPATIASQAVSVSSSSSSAWGGAGMAKSVPTKSSPWAGPTLAEANKPKVAPKTAAAPAKAKAPEKVVKKEEKKSRVSDEAQFISWFISRVRQLNDTVDGDVLASFIQDIANPDEVEDYMVGYLGEGKQVKEFVREYIHKRSELRNKSKSGSVSTVFAKDDDGFSSVGGKKGASANAQQKKKAKFVVDSACLGFRPAGDPNRVNQGEIDHPEPSTGRR
ncbi:hypothetical protein PRIPAC_88729 [Pristionchus pacificus]|uniref:GYF domain-containing protein n=1 Tax=Pristionchus pacificus TaxID=54126 RepID=A0A2A6B928_PRIPA|nr:hypothetical protein PRIPAC_88729 [Pristionchus pacificus]|eukprot:PDM62371.1 hypothetical protein PRIPAC_51813 [Pristionchus pacificus]